MLGLAVVVLVITLDVSSERDLGSGLLPDRPGRSHASALLAGPVTLVFSARTNQYAGVVCWSCCVRRQH